MNTGYRISGHRPGSSSTTAGRRPKVTSLGMTTDDFHLHEEKGDPGRIAIVLPGQGYTAQGPVLSYAIHALLDEEWTVRVLIWDVAPRGAREVYADTLRATVREHPEARHLVIAKSLGTLALPAAAELGMPGAWLTPLLEGPETPPLRTAIGELVAGGVPTLLAGGTGDSLWSTEHARASGARVIDIDGADHSLEVPGDWRASLHALDRVTTAVADLAAEQATPPRP